MVRIYLNMVRCRSLYSVQRVAGRVGDVPIAGLAPAGQPIPGNEPYAVDNKIRPADDGNQSEGFVVL